MPIAVKIVRVPRVCPVPRHGQFLLARRVVAHESAGERARELIVGPEVTSGEIEDELLRAVEIMLALVISDAADQTQRAAGARPLSLGSPLI